MMVKSIIFKKPGLLLILSVILISSNLAQDKKLTIYDAQIGLYFDLKTDNLPQLQWVKGTSNYSYWENKSLIVCNSKNNKVIKSISFSEMKFSDEINKIFNSSKQFEYTWLSENEVLVHNAGFLMSFDIKENVANHVILWSQEADDYSVSPVGTYVAYTLNNNVFIKDFNDKELQITNDSINGIVNGQYVHRREFGIEHGMFWSPVGNKLAFYRKDETMVTKYPLVNIEKSIAEVEYIRYPMAGKNSHQVKIGIYELLKDTFLFLNTIKEKDRYYTNLTWSPDEESLYIQELNRDQNEMKLNRYNSVTGEMELTLFEEFHSKYIEPKHPIHFLQTRPDQFIYFSEKDGYNHMYLYSVNGNELSQITVGSWDVMDIVGVDGRNNVYFTAAIESPLQVSVCKVNLSNGEVFILNPEKGINTPQLNEEYGLILNRVKSRYIPNKIDLISINGEVVQNILTAKNKLLAFNLCKEQVGTIKAADGYTDLYYRMIYPTEFDSTQKYPAILYVYGGPHAQVVKDNFYGSTGLWLQYMAQQGYFVFMLDGRGSDNRGLEFENCIFRQLGQIEMEDQVKGIEFLKSKKYIDSNRIGIHGWSFGGFMTISLMVNYPDLFKVGVAGGPVTSWDMYEVMYGERYMDTPESNREGYELTNVNNKAQNLSGKLLLIHGAKDDVVVWQHSLLFVRKCIESNIPVDYFPYPTHDHHVRGYDKLHLYEKMSNYFIENL